MTNAKSEFFKFNPQFETILWKDNYTIADIDDNRFQANIEFSIVEKDGKQGLIYTAINFDTYGGSSYCYEGVFDCVYDRIIPLGCIAGNGFFRLESRNEVRIVMIKSTLSIGGEELQCFEIDKIKISHII